MLKQSLDSAKSEISVLKKSVRDKENFEENFSFFLSNNLKNIKKIIWQTKIKKIDCSKKRQRSSGH